MDGTALNDASPGASLEPADLIYGLDDKPPLRLSIFVALQHVLAVFVSGTLPPLLKDMFSSGIATGGMCALLLNGVLPGRPR
jgi:xanthine/uracil permease